MQWSNANCSAGCNAWGCAVAVAVVAAVAVVVVAAVAVAVAEAVAVAVLTAMLEIITIAILIWLGKSYSSRVAGGGAVCLRIRRTPGTPHLAFQKVPHS